MSQRAILTSAGEVKIRVGDDALHLGTSDHTRSVEIAFPGLVRRPRARRSGLNRSIAGFGRATSRARAVLRFE